MVAAALRSNDETTLRALARLGMSVVVGRSSFCSAILECHLSQSRDIGRCPPASYSRGWSCTVHPRPAGSGARRPFGKLMSPRRQRRNSPENTVGRGEAGTRGSPATVWTNLREPTMCSAQAYLMTRSAPFKRSGGMVKPRALAALRLITNSRRVMSSKGMSAGLAPLRILSIAAGTPAKVSVKLVP